MALLLKLIPAWVVAAVIALASVAGGAVLVQRNAARHEALLAKTALSGERVERAQEDARRTAAAAAREAAWHNAYQGAMNAYLKEQAQNRGLLDALRAVRLDADSLREQIDTFAAGAAGDTREAIAARAQALGRLLGEALSASEGCAADAEDDNARHRALWNSWPK